MKALILSLVIVVATVPAKAQFAYVDYQQYRRGYYINNNGDTLVGYIRYIRGNRGRIEYFKTGDKKAKKIQPKDCREFVLSDTIKFVRVDAGFSVKIGIGMWDVSDDFVEVLETGKVNLYMHHGIAATVTPGGVTGNPMDVNNLVIGKDSSVWVGLHPNINKRRKEMEKLLKGEDELIEILCRNDAGAIRQGIKQYNSK